MKHICPGNVPETEKENLSIMVASGEDSKREFAHRGRGASLRFACLIFSKNLLV
jgi:hypothetical protein